MYTIVSAPEAGSGLRTLAQARTASMVRMRGVAIAAMLVLMSMSPTRAGDEPEAVARAVTADLAARAFDKVAARFDARMHDALSVEKLAAVWDQIVGQAGPFKTIVSARVVSAGPFERVEVTSAFEKTSLLVSIVLDQRAMISGLFFTPITAAASSLGA